MRLLKHSSDIWFAFMFAHVLVYSPNNESQTLLNYNLQISCFPCQRFQRLNRLKSVKSCIVLVSVCVCLCVRAQIDAVRFRNMPFELVVVKNALESIATITREQHTKNERNRNRKENTCNLR